MTSELNICVMHSRHKTLPGALINLKDKSLQEVESEIDARGFKDWYIDESWVRGCVIPYKCSLKDAISIARLVEVHGSAMGSFLNKVHATLGHTYGQELDNLPGFTQKFNHYYCGKATSHKTFAMWIDPSKLEPRLGEMFKQFPEYRELFNWEMYSRIAFLEGRFCISSIPADEWEMDELGNCLRFHVFASLKDYGK